MRLSSPVSPSSGTTEPHPTGVPFRSAATKTTFGSARASSFRPPSRPYRAICSADDPSYRVRPTFDKGSILSTVTIIECLSRVGAESLFSVASERRLPSYGSPPAPHFRRREIVEWLVRAPDLGQRFARLTTSKSLAFLKT